MAAGTDMVSMNIIHITPVPLQIERSMDEKMMTSHLFHQPQQYQQRN